MQIRITLACDNAAFEDAPGHEQASILRKLADHVENNPPTPGDNQPLRDANGNTVGSYRVEGAPRENYRGTEQGDPLRCR